MAYRWAFHALEIISSYQINRYGELSRVYRHPIVGHAGHRENKEAR
jgi:hypothetical protein